MEAEAFLSYDQDVRDKSFGDWMSASEAIKKPRHRYAGKIGLLHDCLLFTGKDNHTNEPAEIAIPRFGIMQISHGFDDLYSIPESHSLGLTWKPLRLTVMDGGERYIYLIINYRMGFSDNGKWFEVLKQWIGG